MPNQMAMNKVKLIVFLHFVALALSSQSVDYAKIRPTTMVMVCGTPDTGMVNSSIRNLRALDTSEIHKNMDVYYTDLALCYWLKASFEHEDHYLQLCKKTSLQALSHNPKSTKALWNLSLAYLVSDECAKGKYYMDLYTKYAKQREWDTAEVQKMLDNCGI